MNKIYKVIWSKAKNCYVVVSEIAKRNGKCSSSLNKKIIASFLAAGLVTALPMSVEAATFNEGTGVAVGDYSNAWGIDTTAAGANDVYDIRWYQATGWAKPRDVISWKQVYQGGEIRYEMVLKHRDSGELLTLTKRYSDLVNYANFTATDNNTAFGQGTYALGLRATAFGERTYAGGPIYRRGGESANSEKPGYIDYNYDDNGVKKIAFIYLDGTLPDIINETVATTIKRERLASPAVKNATAFGERAVAIGNNSTAFGFRTQATNDNATAWGHETKATDKRATAFGIETTASGRNSTSFGHSTTASGENATAFGSGTIASGGGATSWGTDTQAKAETSTTWGNGSIVHAGRWNGDTNGYSDVEVLRDTSLPSNQQYYIVGINNTTGKRETIQSGIATRAEADNLIRRNGRIGGYNSTAFGMGSQTYAENSLAALGGKVGQDNSNDGLNSAAIGLESHVKSSNAYAMGRGATIGDNSNGSVALGGNGRLKFNNTEYSDLYVEKLSNTQYAVFGIKNDGTMTTQLASFTSREEALTEIASQNQNHTAIENGAVNSFAAIGGKVGASNAIAIGNKATIGMGSTGSVALGGQEETKTTIGQRATNSFAAIGGEIMDDASNAIAIGSGTKVKKSDSIAIGSGNTVTPVPSVTR